MSAYTRPSSGIGGVVVERAGRLGQHRRRGIARRTDRARDRDDGVLLAGILNVGRDALIATDRASRITVWNDNAQAMFGWARIEALGRPLAALFDLDLDGLGGPSPRETLTALAPEGHGGCEMECRRKNGTTFVGLVRAAALEERGGNVRGVVVWVHDMTARRRTEGALRESEARFRNLAESLPQVVWISGSRGALEYANNRLAEYAGHAPVAAEEQTDIVHPDDRARRSAHWDEARRGAAFYECEYRMRRHDGEYRWFLGRALPVRDGAGEVVRWVGFTTDIHDLKVAQDEISEADRRKSEFLAVLSHELRNPLAPIKSALHILERATPGSDQARWAQSIMGRQVDQLARLVDDLLDATRISRGKVDLQRHRVELNELVARTLEDHQSIFDACGVSVELELAPTPLFVDGDWNRLAQVVGNLLQNATKFTERGGAARVRVWPEPASGDVFVSVTDTGIGMTAEMLGSLFQPFVQADPTLDRRRGGLGLGLALVKGLVELHGGEVTAVSEGLGGGSTLTFRLPRARAAPPPQAAPRRSDAKRRRRVLIVEDNADAAACLRADLELDGHEVAVAHDGVTGVQTARELQPEIVLCDIGLPGMDGYAVAQTLRADETMKNTVLVALTGYALPDDFRRATEAGFDRHIAKPPSLESIEEVLRSTDTPG
jgi:PAS domain S-box-containing protein